MLSMMMRWMHLCLHLPKHKIGLRMVPVVVELSWFNSLLFLLCLLKKSESILMITPSKTCTTGLEYAQVFFTLYSRGTGKSTIKPLLIFCINSLSCREISFIMTISKNGIQKHQVSLGLSLDTRDCSWRLTCTNSQSSSELMREHWPDLRVVMLCQPLTLGPSNTSLMPLPLQRRRKP